MVTAFCRQLGWKNMEILISQFQDRLHFGIHSELLELMKLSSLNGVRARTLFDSGFETVTSVASADVNVIENILHKAVPFQSEKEREGDDSHDMKRRNKIKSIWITGCCGMTAKEAAQNLIIEARKHLENEIGVKEIKWSSNVANITKPHEEASNENPPQPIQNTQLENNSCEDILVHKIKQETTTSSKDATTFKKNEDCENVQQDKEPIAKIEETNQISESGPKSFRMSLDLLDISAEDVYTSTNSCIIDAIKNKTKSIKEEMRSPVCDIFQETILVDTSTSKTEIVAQQHSTPIIESNSSEIKGNTVKDEIVWDSLNFTEAALANITKLRTSEKDFSPNISFGETDKSTALEDYENEMKIDETKATSNKDISLFSTDDGENSSFFEESLPLDLIPSRLLDNRQASPVYSKPETTADFASLNSNTIFNAFESPINETDEDLNIQLIFEEDDENDRQPKSCLNLSKDNEVMCSQDNITTIKDFKSPYNKRPYDDNSELNHITKKKKIDVVAIDHNFFKQPAQEKSTIFINQHRLNCVLIKNNDVNKYMLSLENKSILSISLKFKQVPYTKTKIGSNILNVHSQITEDFSFLGMGLHISNGECIFLDNTSLEYKKNIMKYLFESNKRINIHSLKNNYLQLKKELGIQLPITSTDVSIAEWLMDSDESIRSIEYLVSGILI